MGKFFFKSKLFFELNDSYLNREINLCKINYFSAIKKLLRFKGKIEVKIKILNFLFSTVKITLLSWNLTWQKLTRREFTVKLTVPWAWRDCTVCVTSCHAYETLRHGCVTSPRQKRYFHRKIASLAGLCNYKRSYNILVDI